MHIYTLKCFTILFAYRFVSKRIKYTINANLCNSSHILWISGREQKYHENFIMLVGFALIRIHVAYSDINVNQFRWCENSYDIFYFYYFSWAIPSADFQISTFDIEKKLCRHPPKLVEPIHWAENISTAPKQTFFSPWICGE